MLPPQTAEKLRKLLETLDILDLSDIAATSCGNAVQFGGNSKDDYIRVILAYHSSPAEVFARRKLKREYLIKYLWSCDIPVSLSMSKTEAVVRLLQHWQLEEAGAQQVQPHQQQQLPQQHRQQPGLQQQQQYQQTPASLEPAFDNSAEESSFLLRLSDAFARWFFAAYHSPEGVPAQAFEAACDFSVELGGPAMPGARIHRESHRSSDRACRGLSELLSVHGFGMQPNLTQSGLQAERSSFGLVRVTVDCTLHRRSTADAARFGCVGLARLHCLLAPRLTAAAAGGQQQQLQQLEHSYAIRGLRLMLYLESGAGVPACLMLPPSQQQQLQLQESQTRFAIQ